MVIMPYDSGRWPENQDREEMFYRWSVDFLHRPMRTHYGEYAIICSHSCYIVYPPMKTG
jgi:hypothetical protein